MQAASTRSRATSWYTWYPYRYLGPSKALISCAQSLGCPLTPSRHSLGLPYGGSRTK